MKIKTSELTDLALCYSVTMLEMPELVWGETIGIHHASHQIVVPSLSTPQCYSPFTTWAMCGPIIEREKISINSPALPLTDTWLALNFRNQHVYGPTPLVAAMRTYVASKLGDEVDVPDELA